MNRSGRHKVIVVNPQAKRAVCKSIRDVKKGDLIIVGEEGAAAVRGCRNHLVAINATYKAGSLKAAVEKGVLKSGIIYECLKKEIPFVLAGSIRDDGPLPDVITDMVAAQQKYKEQLKNVTMVLMLASTFHAIAVGTCCLQPSNSYVSTSTLPR